MRILVLGVALLLLGADLFADQWLKNPTPGIPRTAGGLPAWFGYSIGKWDGDTFVVESSGFNDNVWLDNAGRPATEALRVTERFRRVNFGRIDIDITIDDPKAYTRPWNVTERLTLMADTDIIEYMCTENNRYFKIVPDAAPPGAPGGRR